MTDKPRGLRMRFPDGRARPAGASSGLYLKLPKRALEPLQQALKSRLAGGAPILIELETRAVRFELAGSNVTDVVWSREKGATVRVAASDIPGWVEALAHPVGQVTLPSQGLCEVLVRFFEEAERGPGAGRPRRPGPRTRAATDFGRPPPILLWFKIYCGVMGAYFLSGCGFGTMFALFANELARTNPTKTPADYHESAVALFVPGIILSIPHWVGLFLPRAKWSWVYGIVLIAVGNLACILCIPVGIPVMIFWVMPNVRAWFWEERQDDRKSLEKIFD